MLQVCGFPTWSERGESRIFCLWNRVSDWSRITPARNSPSYIGHCLEGDASVGNLSLNVYDPRTRGGKTPIRSEQPSSPFHLLPNSPPLACRASSTDADKRKVPRRGR